MAQRVERGVAVVPLRYLTRLPETLSASTTSTTRCPHQLLDDDTAFAFYVSNEYLGFHKDTLVFASKRRDPIVNDVVLFELKNGECRTNCIVEIKSDGYLTIKPIKLSEKMKIEKESIRFDDIEAMSVIVMTSKT